VLAVADFGSKHLRLGIQKQSIMHCHRRVFHFSYWLNYQSNILSRQFLIHFHKKILNLNCI